MRHSLFLFSLLAALLSLPSCDKPPPAAPAESPSPDDRAAQVTQAAEAAADTTPHPIGYIDPAHPYPAPDRTSAGECTLTGTVLDAAGKPVKDAQVYFGNEALKPPPGTSVPPDVTWTPNRSALPTVKTDADGRFLFNYLYAGRSDLWAETPATVGWTRYLDSNAKEVTIRMAPKSESLTYDGTLLDADGKSTVSNARILLLDMNYPSKILTEAATDAAGHYRLQIKPAWSEYSYYLLLALPKNSAIAWCFIPYASAANLDLQLKPEAKFTGRVIDLQGAPIAGATVSHLRLFDPQYGVAWYFGEGQHSIPSAQTDKDGQYTLASIPQGTHVGGIIARQSEYNDDFVKDLDALHSVQAAPDIRLAEGVVIEGTIYLAPGKPAAGAKVTEDDSTGTLKSTTSDKEGHYRISGIRTHGSAYQQLISAEAGAQAGSPPQWDAAAYYEQQVNPGDHITLDLTLKRSFASLEAEWKQKPGIPLTSKYSTVILDDADPEYLRKATYNDALSLRDPAGKTLWEIKGLNVFNNFGEHSLAADPQRKSIWVSENIGRRLLQYSVDGTLVFEKPDVSPNAIALDPKTGNAWVLTQRSTVYGDKLLVFSPTGEKLQEWSQPGADIVYSAHDDCFWIVGKNYAKIDRDGNVLTAGIKNFGFVARSVSANEKDGSVWIAEERHEQVIASRGQIHIVDSDGALRKTFSLDINHFCVAIDNQRGVAWITGQTRLFKTDLDGKPLAEIPLAGASFCIIEPDTGYVWWSSYKPELYRLDTQGRPVWSDPSKTRKTLCFLPPS